MTAPDISQRLNEQLNEWIKECQQIAPEGRLASYIPALERADAGALAIAIQSDDGINLAAGDYETRFTLQSVSKVVNFLAACEAQGLNRILERVDVEPTGDAFDSIIRLEAHKPGKPFNPMINAGAITVASMLPGNTVTEKFEVFLSLLEQILGRKPTVDEEVYESEWVHGHRNRALAHYLKGLGYLDSSVDVALEVYTRECAVSVSVAELAKLGLVLGSDGWAPGAPKRVVSREIARILKSLMVTCGTYNASGKTAAFVGIPSKSGVSGAILSAVPRRAESETRPFTGSCGIGVYGPALDSFGNSIAGVQLLQKVSREWDLSIW